MNTKIHYLIFCPIILVLLFAIILMSTCKNAYGPRFHYSEIGETIRFSNPMIEVIDSVKYVFNDGSDYKYRLDASDDILNKAAFVKKDSAGLIYRLSDNNNVKFNIQYKHDLKVPDFNDTESVENYMASYEVYLKCSKDLMPLFRETFWTDGMSRRCYFFTLWSKIWHPTYKNSLPENLLRKVCMPEKLYFIELSTKNQTLFIPDNWDNYDFIQYYPLVLDKPISEIEHASAGVAVGGYEVWTNTMPLPEGYVLNLTMSDTFGHYDGLLCDRHSTDGEIALEFRRQVK